MSIAVLESTIYSTDGIACSINAIANPTWEQIESSILAQDGHTRPLTRLRVDASRDEPALDILGGNGKFVLWELGGQWLYYDPTAEGDEELLVWTSDQGYQALPCNICFDIGRVVRIAHRFFDTASFESLDDVA